MRQAKPTSHHIPSLFPNSKAISFVFPSHILKVDVQGWPCKERSKSFLHKATIKLGKTNKSKHSRTLETKSIQQSEAFLLTKFWNLLNWAVSKLLKDTQSSVNTVTIKAGKPRTRKKYL